MLQLVNAVPAAEQASGTDKTSSVPCFALPLLAEAAHACSPQGRALQPVRAGVRLPPVLLSPPAVPAAPREPAPARRGAPAQMLLCAAEMSACPDICLPGKSKLPQLGCLTLLHDGQMCYTPQPAARRWPERGPANPERCLPDPRR